MNTSSDTEKEVSMTTSNVSSIDITNEVSSINMTQSEQSEAEKTADIKAFYESKCKISMDSAIEYAKEAIDSAKIAIEATNYYKAADASRNVADYCGFVEEEAKDAAKHYAMAKTSTAADYLAITLDAVDKAKNAAVQARYKAIELYEITFPN